MEQEAEAARRTLGLQTEEDKKRAQFADELERKRHVDQARNIPCGSAVVYWIDCSCRQGKRSSFVCCVRVSNVLMSFFDVMTPCFVSKFGYF